MLLKLSTMHAHYCLVFLKEPFWMSNQLGFKNCVLEATCSDRVRSQDFSPSETCSSGPFQPPEKVLTKLYEGADPFLSDQKDGIRKRLLSKPSLCPSYFPSFSSRLSFLLGSLSASLPQVKTCPLTPARV